MRLLTNSTKGLKRLAVADRIAKTHKAAAFARLKQLIQDTIQAEEAQDYKQAVAKDLAFHRYLVEASQNERLVNFWDSYWLKLD